MTSCTPAECYKHEIIPAAVKALLSLTENLVIRMLLIFTENFLMVNWQMYLCNLSLISTALVFCSRTMWSVLWFVQYKILLYYTKEKPVAFAKITSNFSFVVSGCTFHNLFAFVVCFCYLCFIAKGYRGV